MTEPSSGMPQDSEVEGAAGGKCPKCGYTRAPGSEECPACGVVFSRFRPREESQYRGPEEIGEDLAAAGARFNPYAPPSAAVGQPLFVPETLELADRGARLGARILDALLLMGAVLVGVFLPLLSMGQSPRTGAIIFFAIWFCATLLGFLVWNLRLLHLHGQTVGKKLAKVRIVRSNGEPASLGRIVLLRALVPGICGSIPYLGFVFTLVNILFIFRDDRRCIHDHMADTIVVVAPPAPSPPPATVR